jgi:orotate phosphoribosyltransferase-like protein
MAKVERFKTKVTKEVIDECRKLASKGSVLTQIAAKLDLSTNTIRRIAENNDILLHKSNGVTIGFDSDHLARINDIFNSNPITINKNRLPAW